MGSPASSAEGRRTPGRHRLRARRRRDVGAPGHRRAHPVRVLDGELEASARGSEHTDDALEALHPPRDWRAQQEQHPVQSHRPHRRSCARRSGGTAVGNPPDRKEYRDAVQHRVELRRPRRNRRRRAPGHRRGYSGRGARRTAIWRIPVHSGAARSRSPDPDERRNACQQFSAVANRVRRDLGHRYVLARLPPARSPEGDRRVSEARSPIWRHQAVRRRARRQVTRVLSGAVLLAIAVAVVWFAPAGLFLIVAELLLVLACYEFVGLARTSKLQTPAILATIAAAAVCSTFSRIVADWPLLLTLDLVLLVSFLMIAAYETIVWRPGTDAVGSASAALLPLLYLGLPIGSMVALRELHGPQVLFLMMLTVFVSDSAQYYSGRSFGKHLLAPAISPKKTVEGAIGGFIFGALVLTVVGAWWLPSVPPVARMFLGVGIVIAGIAGDLFESMLKRSAGVKDSSALIPGHGGILDRIDALLFAAPVYYVFLKYAV